MTVDERVSRILGEMVADLTPVPDPYDRVRARYRRRQRRRMAAAGAGLTALVLVGGVVVVRPGGGDSPSEATVDQQSWRNVTAWSERLVQSPPRGAAAGDSAFVAELSSQLLDRQRRGEYSRKEAMSAVHVLFVDDLGPYRVALAAFVRTTHAPNFWAHASMWVAGRKGASAAELAAPANVVGGSDAVEPYTHTSLENLAVADQQVHLAIAPAGCQFETAAWPGVRDWVPEPTGSYLVRTPPTVRPEWWRVTCDGVLREKAPSPIIREPVDLSAAEIDKALSRARGKVHLKWAEADLRLAAQNWGYEVTDLPSVVWNGRIEGTTPSGGTSFDGTATVLAAPQVGGGWRGEVLIAYERETPTGSLGASAPFYRPTDPSDPSAVVVIPLDQRGPTLVITPEAATGVRATRDGQVVAQAPVKDASAVLTIPVGDDVVVEALDAAGAVLGSGTVANDTGVEPAATSTWHED